MTADDLTRWCKELWQDNERYCVIACGKDGSDDWPLESGVCFLPSEIDTTLTKPPENRSWYCTYPQVRRRVTSWPVQQDMGSGFALWADVDGYKSRGEVRGLEPSFIVQTSKEGFHFGWLLNDSEIPEEIEAYNRAIAQEWTKTDHVHNANRWMRLPYGFNYKASHGEPFRVHLAEATWKRYSLLKLGLNPIYEQTADMGDLSPGPQQYPHYIDRKWGHTYPLKLRAYLHSVQPQRHRALWGCVGMMARLGMSFGEIYWRLYESPNDKFHEDVEYRNGPDFHYHGDIVRAYTYVTGYGRQG